MIINITYLKKDINKYLKCKIQQVFPPVDNFRRQLTIYVIKIVGNGCFI